MNTHLVTLAGVFLCASGASADLVAFGGDVTVLDSPPGSVAEGALESDNQIFCFREKNNYVLTEDVAVSIAQPGSYSRKRDLTPGTVLAGSVVDSWLLHFDPETNSKNQSYEGFLTFDGPVWGIIVCWKDLNASNTVLGASETIYTSKRGDGLENNGRDSLTWDALTNTVSFSGRASSGIDHIRILTEPLPTPGSLALFSAGCLLFGNRRRRH